MKNIRLSILALFITAPLYGQGLTVTMTETGPVGKTAPTLQFDATHARLDIPSLASQVLYDSTTKTLRLLVPLVKIYGNTPRPSFRNAPQRQREGQRLPFRLRRRSPTNGQAPAR